jgi:carbon starvation protein CstA
VKPEYVVAIVLRVFAIILSVSAISGLARSAWVYFGAATEIRASVLLTVVTVVILAAAYFLWQHALPIGLRLVRFDDSPASPSIASVSLDDLQAVALTILGFYFLIRSVAGGVFWFFFFSKSYAPDPEQWASIMSTVAEFLLASFLVFRAHGLTALLRKLRLRRPGADDAL